MPSKRLQNFTKSKVYLRAIIIACIPIIYASLGIIRNTPLVSSIFAGALILILSGWWLWRVYKRKGLARTPISFPLTLLILSTLISYIFSENPRSSLNGLLATTAYVLIFFLICDLLLSGWKYEIFELALLITVSYFMILATFQITSWYLSWYRLNVPEYPIFPMQYRLFSIVAHPNLFVALIYMALPFAIFRLKSTNSRYGKAFWIIWLLFAEIVIYYLNSRGGMIASFIVLLITILWLIHENGIHIKKQKKEWLQKNKSILAAVFMYTLVMIFLIIFNNIPSHSSAVLQHAGGITGGRWEIWKVAFNMIGRNPIIGLGPGTFVQNYFASKPMGLNSWISTHAHNYYFDVWAQLGLFGLLIIGWVILAPPWQYLKQNTIIDRERFIDKTNQRRLVSIIAVVSGVIVHSFVDVPLSIPLTIIPIIILIAIGLNSANLISEGRSVNPKLSIVVLVLIPLVITLQALHDNAQLLQLQSLISHKDENWAKTTTLLDTAIRLDPNFSFYDELRGYAYGNLSNYEQDNISNTALSNAIEICTNVIESNVIWVPNYINLAYLLQEQGEQNKAIQLFESIPSRWYEPWPFANLFIAESYRKNGEIDKAEKYYNLAFIGKPWVKEMIICKKSPTCLESSSSFQSINDDIYNFHNISMGLIQTNNPKQALQLLERFSFSETTPLLWIDRASAHIDLKEYKHAEYALLVAENQNATQSLETLAYYILIKSKLLSDQKRTDEAISMLESYLRPTIRPKRYDNELNSRYGFPDPYLVSLSALAKNNSDLQLLIKLANLYQSKGNIHGVKWATKQIIIIEKNLDQIQAEKIISDFK